MKYYWLLDSSKDLSVTGYLIDIGATHVRMHSFGPVIINMFVKYLTDEEVTYLTLKLGNSCGIWPLTEDDRISLIENGLIMDK